jgi:isocitrate/isopropylmalate dehydrogenase
MYRIAVIPGDGIGKEVVPEGIRVLDAVGKRFGIAFEWQSFPWGCEYYMSKGEMMPPSGLDILKKFDAIFLGAVGFPTVPDYVSLWGLLIPIRRTFRQYVNLRPIRLLRGIVSPLVTGPAQLVRHRLDRHPSLGLLSLIETLNLGVEPHRKVGRFDKCPGQILIAVLGITLALFLAVADLLTADTATVRSEVSHTGKSPDVPGLKHDRERENLADPRHGFKKAELRTKLDSLCDGSLQDLRLFIGAAHDR